MNQYLRTAIHSARNRKRRPWRLTSLTKIAFFVGSVFYTVMASNAPIEAFQPGSDEIDEADILHRIEEEIVAPKKLISQEKGSTTGGRPNDAGHWLTIQRQSNEVGINGFVHLSQDSVKIGEDEKQRKVPLLMVRRLQILKWRPLCLRRTMPTHFDVLMIPDQVVLTLTNNSTIEGVIDGENWMQLTLESAGERKGIPLSFTISIEADSEAEAMQKAVNQKADSDLFALLSFQTTPSTSREKTPNDSQETSQR